MTTRNRETTGKKAASAAGKTLSNPNASQNAKSAAASALTQYKTRQEQTSARAASAAAKVLSDPRSSKAEKSAAASTLTQRADKKGS